MIRAIVSALAFCAMASAAAAMPETDAQIRRDIIQESTASRAGACPCPYRIAADGKPCGKNSDYVRMGGKSPACYPADITPAMIEQYREFHGLRH